eukprot:3279000-Rhodomonas_salina.1
MPVPKIAEQPRRRIGIMVPQGLRGIPHTRYHHTLCQYRKTHSKCHYNMSVLNIAQPTTPYRHGCPGHRWQNKRVSQQQTAEKARIPIANRRESAYPDSTP